jgi:hypothetical protein
MRTYPIAMHVCFKNWGSYDILGIEAALVVKDNMSTKGREKAITKGYVNIRGSLNTPSVPSLPQASTTLIIP